MITSRLNQQRHASARFALLCIALIVLTLSLGTMLALAAAQVMPPTIVTAHIAAPISGPSVCVSAPTGTTNLTTGFPALPSVITLIKTRPDTDRLIPVPQPAITTKPSRPHVARSVHGRVRGRYAARD
jgi:hypothetical protein